MQARRSHKKFPLALAIALFSSVVPLLFTESASAQVVITVPGDHPTIQSAIDAAVAGDTVLVAPGTYFENINFRGKAITVESDQGPEVTIIDGNLAGSVVTFSSGEGPASVLRGFTLQRGNASGIYGDYGGGVRIKGSSPTIQGNIITNNTACGSGGGIEAEFSSARIEGNLITNNTQSLPCSGGPGGGGISVLGAGQTQIIDNIIEANSWGFFGGFGGGITLFGGTPTVRGNVIRGNSVVNHGGGIDVGNSDALIVQNLITGNQAEQGGGIYWVVGEGERGPLVVNNTIADNLGQGSGIFARGFDAGGRLFNNIVLSTSGESAIYCYRIELHPCSCSTTCTPPAGLPTRGAVEIRPERTGISRRTPCSSILPATTITWGRARHRSTRATTPLPSSRRWTSMAINGSSMPKSIKGWMNSGSLPALRALPPT